MDAYGILLVDTSWSNEDSARIDKTAHLRHQDHLVKGSQALIYMREPIDAVVAEAEIIGDVVETESEALDDSAFNAVLSSNMQTERSAEAIEAQGDTTTALLPNQAFAKVHLVPLKVTRRKGHAAQIPLSRLRVILGSDFSVYDETWIPLSKDQYQQIVALWDKQTAS